MTSLRLWLNVVLCCTLASCGWQLRGMDSGQFPSQLQLATADRYAPLVVSLARAMQTRHIQSTENAPLRLELDSEKLTKRTVAVTSIGSAAQYELTLSARWRLYALSNNTQTLLRDGTASSVRVFDFQTGNNLGKTEEENTLMNEMRREISSTILQNTQGLGTPHG